MSDTKTIKLNIKAFRTLNTYNLKVGLFATLRDILKTLDRDDILSELENGRIVSFVEDNRVFPDTKIYQILGYNEEDIWEEDTTVERIYDTPIETEITITCATDKYGGFN